MNNKGQTGPVAFVFYCLFFMIVISIIGGNLWTVVAQAGTTAGLSGLELFIYNNFALITLFSFTLGIIVFYYFGGSN